MTTQIGHNQNISQVKVGLHSAELGVLCFMEIRSNPKFLFPIASLKFVQMDWIQAARMKSTDGNSPI